MRRIWSITHAPDSPGNGHTNASRSPRSRSSAPQGSRFRSPRPRSRPRSPRRRVSATGAGRQAALLPGGLELQEIAPLLSVSERTVKRDWAFGRAWLVRELALSSPVR
ncbi:MAG: ECF-type sigma factor [Thermoanaerobaculia bacterium]